MSLREKALTKLATSTFIRGVNNPATTEATKEMTSLFAAAATIGAVTGNPVLLSVGAAGSVIGVTAIRKNGQDGPGR